MINGSIVRIELKVSPMNLQESDTVRIYCLFLGYHNYYAIHGSPYTSAHVLIENTLVQHKMAKNSRMALCCQNRVSKGTGRCYGLHISANISVHCASVVVLGLLKKKERWKDNDEKEGVKYLRKHSITAVINGLDKSELSYSA